MDRSRAPYPPASQVTYTPFGDIAATNVQTAIEELDDEKEAVGASLYLMTTYHDTHSPAVPRESDARYRMYLAGSVDGVNFDYLNRHYSYQHSDSMPVGHAASTLTRDVAITWHGGYFWVMHPHSINDTAGAPEDHFDLAKSADLITWEYVASPIDTAVSMPGNLAVFSGEFFTDDDGSTYFLFPVMDGVLTEFQLWESHPTNAAWTTWSDPVMLTDAVGAHLGDYDPWVVKTGSTYYLFGANPNIRCMSAPAITGPYTEIHALDWGGWDDDTPGDIESQNVIQLASGDYRLYFDCSVGYGMYYSDCAAEDFPLGPWTTAKPIRAPVPGSGASFIRLTDATAIRKLREAALFKSPMNYRVVTPVVEAYTCDNAADIIISPGLKGDTLRVITLTADAGETQDFVLANTGAEVDLLYDLLITQPSGTGASAAPFRFVNEAGSVILSVPAQNTGSAIVWRFQWIYDQTNDAWIKTLAAQNDI